MKLAAASLVAALVVLGTATVAGAQSPAVIRPLPDADEFIVNGPATLAFDNNAVCDLIDTATGFDFTFGCPDSDEPNAAAVGAAAGTAGFLLFGPGTATLTTTSPVSGGLYNNNGGTASGGSVVVNGVTYDENTAETFTPAIATNQAATDVSIALFLVGGALAGIAALWLAVRLVLRWIFNAGAAA